MSVIDGEMTAGALIAFLIYAINLANPVRRISEIYGDIQKSLAAADRVFETIDTEPDVKEKPDAIVLPPVKGKSNSTMSPLPMTKTTRPLPISI